MTLADGFDLCMVLLVVFFAVKGLFRGFSGEVFSLAGIIGGIYFGLAYADPADAVLRGYFPALSPSLSRIIAIAVIFFVVCVVCALAGKLFRALLSLVSLSTLDRLCGFLLGVVKGAAIVVLIVVLLTRIQSFLPGVRLSESRVVVLVNAVMPEIEGYLDAIFPKQII